MRKSVLRVAPWLAALLALAQQERALGQDAGVAVGPAEKAQPAPAPAPAAPKPETAPSMLPPAAVTPTRPNLEVAGAQMADEPEITEDQIRGHWLKNSPEVASWRTQVGAARFDVVTSHLWPNPELTMSGAFLLVGTPPDGKKNYFAQLSQPLPIFGQRKARVAAAKQMVSVAEMQVLAMLWDRAYGLQKTMVERAFSQARMDMLQKNLSELGRIRTIVQKRTSAGANSQYDLYRVELAAGTLEAEATNAKVARDFSEAQLLAMAADPTLKSAPITVKGLRGFRGPNDEQSLIDLALERRPDMLLAKNSSRAAYLQAERFRRERIPTPSLFGSGYLVYEKYGFQITGGISVPLPTTDRNQGLIGRALTEQRGHELLMQALDTRIRQEVSGSWQARNKAKDALESFRAHSLAVATELLRRAEVSYELGAFSIAQLFDAYQTMWEARTQELQLERQSADAEVDLEHAASLWPIETGK